MDLKDIDYAIKTKRLRLTFERVMMHFSWIIGLILISIYITVDMLPNNTDEIVLLISLITSILGLFWLFYKYAQLNFTVFKIELKRKEIYFALDKLCETNKWHFKEQRFKTAVFDPKDFEGGEISMHSDHNIIRIILIDDEIYINYFTIIGGNNNIGKWNPEKIFREITELRK
jgi:hypothetical protein